MKVDFIVYMTGRLPIEEKIHIICQKVYGADDVEYAVKATVQLKP
jgi:formyltetrahydrofolate synthetase